MRRVGPKLTVTASCFDCSFCKSEYYAVQGDSGRDVSCTHPPYAEKPRYIGDSTWRTPAWCPAPKSTGDGS